MTGMASHLKAVTAQPRNRAGVMTSAPANNAALSPNPNSPGALAVAAAALPSEFRSRHLVRKYAHAGDASLKALSSRSVRIVTAEFDVHQCWFLALGLREHLVYLSGFRRHSVLKREYLNAPRVVIRRNYAFGTWISCH
jgi:hypothetical protein